MGRIGRLLLILSAAAVGTALPAVAQAKTVVVHAGPPALGAAKRELPPAVLKTDNPNVNAFFSQKVTLNAGDTVKFINNGEHTIDLPGSSGRDVPLILPGPTVSGVLDAAGNPFWFDGHAPSLNLNPALLAPAGGHTYNGSKRVDSGLSLGNGSPPPFKVTFTRPGVYKYFCDLHPGMVGYVTVVPKGKPVPSAAQDKAALDRQVQTAIKAVKTAVKTKVPANTVSVGESGPGGVELFAMFPATLHVNADTVVTFTMSRDTREAHTATFGPTALLTKLSNGLFSNPAITQQGLYPSDNPALGPIPVSPTSHGDGFANSGALDRDPTTPLPVSEKIDFTTPGTYHYQCLIHPFMHGTIIVR